MTQVRMLASRVLCKEPPPPGMSKGGIILPPTASVATDGQGHEVEVVEPGASGIPRGTRVIISVGNISAFINVDGAPRIVIPDSDIWAAVDAAGDVQPRGRQVVLQRDDEAMHRYVLGKGALSQLPESTLAHGWSASGDPVPQQGGRTRDALTVLYARVVRGAGLDRGTVVCFSPSFCSTRLKVDRRQLWLVDADEIFFEVADG